MSEEFKNGTKFDCKIVVASWKCTYTQELTSLVPKASKNVQFSSFSSVHTVPSPKCADWSSVFKIYRFQILPAKKVPFSCEWEAYPSAFHRFQNVLASCERSLKYQICIAGCTYIINRNIWYASMGLICDLRYHCYSSWSSTRNGK